MRTTIQIRGARENNLQNVDVEIPRDKLIVVTGMSGSGKSSLAFDTLYAEGQRRLLASMSTFAKRFVGQLKKPDVDFVNGLSPVVSIDQKTVGANPRSTVGTMTDISDYLRMLFATMGTPHCPLCGEALAIRTPYQMMEHLLSLPKGTEVEVRAPVYKIHGEDYEYLFEQVRVNGYRRARIDGKPRDLGDHIDLDEEEDHSVEAVIDSFVVNPGIDQQVVTSLEHGLKLGDGLLGFHIVKPKQQTAAHKKFYDGFGCARHRLVAGEMQAFEFTFNDPAGACPTCAGIGTAMRVHPSLLVPDPKRSLNEGAFVNAALGNSPDSWGGRMLYSLAAHYGFSLDTPFQDLAAEHVQVLLHGTKGEQIEVLVPPKAKQGLQHAGKKIKFQGVVNQLEHHYRQYRKQGMSNAGMDEYLKKVMVEYDCPECGGARLKRARRLVTIANRNLYELGQMHLVDLLEFLKALKPTARQRAVADTIVREVTTRLELLIAIGLDYLSLNRRSATLSGGESQRIRLSSQIGSGLMGMLYVLDEPSIGLHPKDNVKMIETLKRLRDLGNTVIVVEHDADTIRAADHVLEIGPGPGVHGGRIVAEGPLKKILQDSKSLTGAYLSGKRSIAVPAQRRPPSGKSLVVRGAVKTLAAFAAGKAAVSGVSPSVAALSEGMVKAMFFRKLKIAAILLLALAGGGTGLALFIQGPPRTVTGAAGEKSVSTVNSPAKPGPGADVGTKPGAFNGEWRTSIGIVKLKQTGSTVTGTYGNAGQFTLKGTVEGKTLTFEYQEGQARGDAHWTMDESGHSFRGDFRVRGGQAGVWQGWRPDPEAAKGKASDLSGLWLTDLGLMELEQAGDKVKGRYALGGVSQIEGTVTGRMFKFKYKAFRPGTGWFDLTADGATIAGAAVTDGFAGWYGWRGRRAPEFARYAKLVPGKIVEGSTKGLLTYSVRAPEGYKEGDGKKWPAVVILHGSNMNGRAYVSTIAAAWPDIAKDYLLIGINGETPSATGDDPQFNYTYVNFVGRSTFKGFPGTDRESPALVAEALDAIRKVYPVSRYFVGGHSQGGFLSYSLLMNYPEQIAGAFPISAGVIFQCEPTAYTDEKLRAAQRSVPLAIIHGKNDPSVDFSSGEYAAVVFGEAGWPAFRFFADASPAGHRFGLLPVAEAIRWLEVQTTDDPTRLLDFAEQRMKAKGGYRDAVAALNRARTLKVDAAGDAAKARLDRLSTEVDAKAAAGAKQFLPKIRNDQKQGKTWIDAFLAYRDDFEFAPAARDVMQAFYAIRAEHSGAAEKALNEANAAFQQGKRDEGYAKYQEIVDKHYAAPSYRNVKRWLEQRQ